MIYLLKCFFLLLFLLDVIIDSIETDNDNLVLYLLSIDDSNSLGRGLKLPIDI
jgi:hypothetical protein